MKQALKKLLSFVVSAVMVMMFAAPAMAEESTSITLPDNKHTYEIYQIFKGDYADGKLSNVVLGKNGTLPEGVSVENAIENLVAVQTATDKEKLAVAENYVSLSNPYKTANGGQTVAVEAGYYLIKDKDDSVTGDDFYTLYILQIAGKAHFDPKGEKPSVDKQVLENSNNTWQEGADYETDKPIPYRLVATLGDMSDYDTYSISFKDTLSKGLEIDKNSIEVYLVNGELNEGTVTTGYVDITNFTKEVKTIKDGTELAVSIDNVKSIQNAVKGSKIVVMYTASLNENCVYGSKGNPNKVYLEYSNNPNSNQGGDKGTTPEDEVIVYTFQFNVNKVDGDNKRLLGADFELYRKNGDEWGATPMPKDSIFVSEDGIKAAIEEIENDSKLSDEEKQQRIELVIQAGSLFIWSGLDSGEYKLVETKTPEGYNSVDDYYFTLEATIEEENLETLVLKSNNVTISTQLDENKFMEELIKLEHNAWVCHECAIAGIKVVNREGTTLPETGGMGTTLFYVLGSIMVLGAGVLLVSKRRADAE